MMLEGIALGRMNALSMGGCRYTKDCKKCLIVVA